MAIKSGEREQRIMVIHGAEQLESDLYWFVKCIGKFFLLLFAFLESS
jgi:hypothetical protein